MKHFIFCAAFAASAVSVAEEYLWSPNEADPANTITNVCHFPVDPGSIGPSDILTFSANEGETELTLPAGTVWASSVGYKFNVGAGSKLRFDLAGAKWTQADLVDGDYTDRKQLNIHVGNSEHFSVKANVPKGTTTTKLGAFAFDDAEFSLSNGEDGVFRFDLNRGNFDLRAPNGTDTGASIYWPLSKNVLNSQLAFHAGSHAELPTVLLYAYCPTNEIIVDGGRHYIANLNLRLADKNSDVGDRVRTRVTVSGEGTELALGKLATGEGHTYVVNVVSNAVLSFTGTAFSQTATGMGQIVVDGASIVFTNSAALSDAFTATTPDIYVTNGTFLVELGKFFKIGNGRLSCVDSAFCADNFGLINSPEIDFLRSDFVVTNKCYLGYNTFSRPVVNLRGGRFEFGINMVVGESATSDATLNLLDGVESSGYRLTVGDVLNATGTVNIASGVFELEENLIIGNKGSGTVNVSGGTNSCWKILLCNNKDSASQKALYNQTGGRVVVRNDMTALPTAGVSGSTALVRLCGGELVVDTVAGGPGSSAVNPAQSGVAQFEADGGTIVAKGTKDIVSGFNTALLGANGLRIELADGKRAAIPQSFANMPEAAGCLVLAGLGEKVVSGSANTVSDIVVEEGSVVFAAGASAASRVTVRGGAAVSFGAMGASGTLSGLTVGEVSKAGVVRLAQGESIAVCGPIEFVNGEIEFDCVYAIGATQVLFSSTAPVSQATRDALALAIESASCEDGAAVECAVETDSEGVTYFKMIVRASETFRISAESESLSDSQDRVFARGDTLAADVGSGLSMTLSGKLSSGSLVKSGLGVLSLTNPLNMLLGGIVSEAGIFDVVRQEALACGGLPAGDFILRGGTLRFSDNDEQAFARRLVIDAEEGEGVTNAVVLKADSPVTVGSLNVKSGALLKRGAAKLTIAPGPDTATVLSAGDGRAYLSAWPAPKDEFAVFDEAGNPPESAFTGFAVAEGELVLKGDSTTRFSIPNVSSVGIRCTPGTVQPVLTVDGANLAFGVDGKRFVVGGSVQAGDFATNAEFRVVNGGRVTVGSLVCANAAKALSQPRVTIDASTVVCNILNGGYDSSGKAVPLFTVRNGGVLCAVKGVNNFGPADMVFSDSSVFAKNEQGEPLAVQLKYEGGDWRFGSGAEFRCASISLADFKAASRPLRLSFDAGKFITCGADIVFENPQFIAISAEEGGLELPVENGKTQLIAKQVSGPGGIVKTGEGTLVVDCQMNGGEVVRQDPCTLACTGTSRIENGVLELADSQAVAEGSSFDIASGARFNLAGQTLKRARISGGGTLAGGRFENGTIIVPAQGSGSSAVVLENVDFSGRTVFNIASQAAVDAGGRTIVVARYSGAAPSTQGFRVRGLSNVGAEFEAADGEVRARLFLVGARLIVR